LSSHSDKSALGSLAATNRPRLYREASVSSPYTDETGEHIASLELDGPQGRVWGELLRLVDIAIAGFFLCGVFVLFNLDSAPDLLAFLELRLTVKHFMLVVGFLVSWSAIFTTLDLYHVPPRGGQIPVGRLATACGLGSIALIAFPILSESGAFSYWIVPSFFLVTTTAAISSRGLLRSIERSSKRRKSQPERRVLVVGGGSRGERVLRRLLPVAHVGIVGIVDPEPGALNDAMQRRTVGGIGDLEGLLMRHAVDDVIIALPIKTFYGEIQRVVNVCERMGVKALFLADLFDSSVAKPSVTYRSGLPIVEYAAPIDDFWAAVKRAIDVVGSAVGLVLLAPVLLVIAAAIKLSSPGPVFFMQDRIGRNRRTFRMLKFRTMVENAESLMADLEHLNEAQGPLFKMRDDPRVTWVGKYLRRWSVDELPQLVNVLKGDMSLVGPRPMSVRDATLFDEGWLMRRFSVTPGITGPWQVRGRSNVPFSLMIKYDLQYIDEWSLRTDLMILWQTLPVVWRGSGAM
jgi:exopolysaccharide biosynthesis polyprenyl glycosylphosphotransferase